MTRGEAIDRLRELQHGEDIELDHETADEILCNLLDSLGYGDVVEEWKKINKWYA